ncbi:SGNH/GDSL hydrolase family protein [Methylobacterium sp. J-076]|uniref:SGNH/GDSL hydrolase family protein n=1 Tax=Methylobacterium sp. J-076 TaxID=2836655 RepID=UPI001FBA5AD7|nr:SGNH/GDSL hydrolase family protein [Methylobacterium sp. J-076]MCJ2012571.1 SGNH/GDSL hydrolase family protein [Methylobacterium sp. J-076]
MGAGPLGWLRRALQRRRYRRICRARIAMRIPQIQRDLAAADPGFTFVMGDSHAEFLCAHPLGRRPVVNGGIGGISTGGYAERLPALRFRHRAGVAVLVVGSNDLSVRVRPLSPEAVARFEAAAAALIVWLHARADRVVVLALPPITQVPGQEREAAAVEDYSARLARIAGDHGGEVADPCAGLRAGPGGLARPGALSDGVHLADYAAAAARVGAILG